MFNDLGLVCYIYFVTTVHSEVWPTFQIKRLTGDVATRRAWY